MGTVLCEHCTAVCCKAVSLPLDAPETAGDYGDVRWYLAHKGVTVFVEEDKWYVTFVGDCDYLRPDDLCAVYEDRPRICRGYSTDNCDYHGGDYEHDQLFNTPDELAAYLDKKPGVRGKRRSKSGPARVRSAGDSKTQPLVWDLPQ